MLEVIGKCFDFPCFPQKLFPTFEERVKPVVRREYIDDEDKVERQDVTDIGDSEDNDQDEDQGEDEEDDDNVEELFVSEIDQSAPIASSRNPDKFQVQVSFSIRFNWGNMFHVYFQPPIDSSSQILLISMSVFSVAVLLTLVTGKLLTALHYRNQGGYHKLGLRVPIVHWIVKCQSNHCRLLAWPL